VNVNEATSFSVKGTKSVSVRPAGQVTNALSITAGRITAGTTGAVTVKVTDQYGNPVAQSADLEVTVVAASPTGKFYDQAEGGSEITAVTIPQGESEATVYYYDTTAGDQKITVSAPGLDPAEGTITVVAADPAKIAVEADELVVNQRAEINFTIVDEFGNPVELDSALTLVLSSSSAIGRFEDESGEQITQVTIPAGQSSATAYYKDSQPGEVTITARTTGLEGSAVLTVQEEDTTPPVPEAEFTRKLSSGWQVFSVPVKLDKSLVDLLGGADKFEVLYLYDAASQSWKLYSQMTSEEQYGKPLVGYVVKMKQDVLAQADYKKVTATQAIPPTLALKQGWNLVGVSVPEDETTSYNVGDMLASVKDKFSTVVNPGLGNQVTWKALTSTSEGLKTAGVPNGDAYWVFMTADGTLAGLMAPPVE
jgi:hypothetical protein